MLASNAEDRDNAKLNHHPFILWMRILIIRCVCQLLFKHLAQSELKWNKTIKRRERIKCNTNGLFLMQCMRLIVYVCEYTLSDAWIYSSTFFTMHYFPFSLLTNVMLPSHWVAGWRLSSLFSLQRYCTSFCSGIMVRLRSTCYSHFRTEGGAIQPRYSLSSLIVTRYFPNQPAIQPAKAWHMRFYAHTHTRWIWK